MRRRSAAASAALSLPAAAYGVLVRARNRWYDRPGARQRATIPVISVGNLAVGGTGKTPLVAWIVKQLLAMRVPPAVVSRGYGGTAGPGPLLVSTGEGPRVNARACGDEPHLLARSLKGTIVIVGADRVEGARAAARAGAGAVILDDGFQHRRLARDLDIVILDGRSPFADGQLLPRGSLREPPSSINRADLVVLSRVRQGDPVSGAIHEVRSAGFSGPIVRAGHRTLGLFDNTGARRSAPPSALAFCGIGDSGLFRRDVEAMGVVASRFHSFRDHQPYTVTMWDRLVAEAHTLGVPMVTTDKDLSRLEASVGASLAKTQLYVLRIETVLWDEATLLAALHGVIARSHNGAAR